MTCPACREAVEQVRNLKVGSPAPLKHNSWFVCEECGSISRVVVLGGVMMLRGASIDEFADSNADHEATIRERRRVMKIINAGKLAAFNRVKANILRLGGKK